VKHPPDDGGVARWRKGAERRRKEGVALGPRQKSQNAGRFQEALRRRNGPEARNRQTARTGVRKNERRKQDGR